MRYGMEQGMGHGMKQGMGQLHQGEQTDCK